MIKKKAGVATKDFYKIFQAPVCPLGAMRSDEEETFYTKNNNGTFSFVVESSK